MNKNPYLILAFASLCWSGNHIVGRAIAGHFPPLTISTIRWFIPAIILWIAVRSRIEQDWPLICRHWIVMLWLGATGGILFSALQYVGLQYTSAVNVSILNSLVPVLIIAASALIFRDRILPIQLLGILTSLIGVLIIVTRGNLNALLQLSFNHGDVIIIVNMIVFAIYAAYLRLRPKIHWMSFLFVLAVVSAVGTMPFAIFELASGRIPELNVGTIAGGLNINSVPDRAAIGIDIRTIPGQNHAGIRTQLASYIGTDVELGTRLDAQSVWTNPNDAWIGTVVRTAREIAGVGGEIGAAPYFTDASILTPALGTPPTAIIGPGELELAHQTDEYCLVSRIEQATEIYSAIIRDWCGL